MGRRLAGDGTLFKRKDGLWVGGVELPPGPDGKRRVKRVTSKDRNRVLEKLRELRGQVAAGQVPSSPTVTVGTWMDYWCDHILPRRKIKPSTRYQYEGVVRRDIKPAIGHLRLHRLQPADLRRFYVELEQRVSARAAQKADQVLRLALKAAVRDGVLPSSVMGRVDKPVYGQQEQSVFTADTALLVVKSSEQIQGRMWSARWAVGFTTGARESEILGLEWDRVDFDNRVIDLSWQLLRLQKQHGCGEATSEGFPCGKVRSAFCPAAWWDLPPWMEYRPCEGTLVWTRPKTKAGVRLVPLIPEIVAVLGRLRSEDTPANRHGLVFHHDDGRPWSQELDQRMWKALLHTVGIPHVPQHTIRRSTATFLLEAGVDAHVIQQVIGHSDIAHTRSYQFVSLELARRAWANLGGLVPIST